MKVVFFHEAILPVKKYGGTERILYWHMVELVKQGHQVALIGNPLSTVEKQGIQLIPFNPKIDPDFENYIPDDADIFHLHFNYKVKKDIPTIVNVHGNGQLGEEFPLNTVFLSKKHAQNHSSEQFVYNALDFNEYPFDPGQKKKCDWENFLFLAKGSWGVKNLKHCVKASKKSKKHLHIVGGRSLWPSAHIHNYGMLGGVEKLETIKKCDALLFPVRWHEPFGIAIIEAMAMGLPVIGSPFGSLPEIITPDVGIICQNYEELLRALSSPRPSFFEAERIRSYVENKFHIRVYTQKYLELYRQILKGIPLNSAPPTLKTGKRPEDMLPF